MLIGVALFLKFGCHGCDYIDGMLTGRAVAHKWFRDRKNAFEIRYRQLEILWRLWDNVKSHGQLASLSSYSFYKSNNWTAEDTAETSTKLKALGQSRWNFSFNLWIGSDPFTRNTRDGNLRTRPGCTGFIYLSTQWHLFGKNDHFTLNFTSTRISGVGFFDFSSLFSTIAVWLSFRSGRRALNAPNVCPYADFRRD